MDTTKFYDKAYDWMLRVGPKILLAVVIFVVAQLLIRLLKRWVRSAMHKKEFDSSLQSFLISFVFTVLQVLAILATMQVLGIEMTIFAALVGGIGVAAGLALSGTLQNFTSGILILMLKPFRVGDIILAQGQEGRVSSIQIFYTILVTYDNRDVIIPNSKLSNDLIVNISQEGRRRMDLDIKLPYTIDYTAAIGHMRKTLSSMPDMYDEPAPYIGIGNLEVDGYHVIINAWTGPEGFNERKMAVSAKLLSDMRAGGIKWPGMA
ncbi:MAG: mechanosensitive ion channel family protein [Bacteroidetes bacterium]|nr:mechanosensitive ion channel family protein [Bacteroidota bacterium]